MSKSLGNGVDPVDIANRMGGEIVRLWVASVHFREDMAASENLTWPHWFKDSKVIIPEQAVNGLDLLWQSDLVVSGGCA